jgi:hypothetical protein
MSSVDEYHESARDCVRWAAKARTEEQRRQFLRLAHEWTQAALRLGGAPSPSESDNERLETKPGRAPENW